MWRLSLHVLKKVKMYQNVRVDFWKIIFEENMAIFNVGHLAYFLLFSFDVVAAQRAVLPNPEDDNRKKDRKMQLLYGTLQIGN